MTSTLKFEDSLDAFQNIVTLYRSESGNLYIGNTFFYNGRGVADDWMSVMYKDPLPEENGILSGWNWMDDNSPFVTLVPEENAETAVEDFMYAHGAERSWKDLPYHVIKNYAEIEAYLKHNPLAKGNAEAFGILR